ncbi:hypothetical protein LGM58_38365 [Burkholderia contaminans]|uniref:hypothetical protein n=1 Tax=Burkholderia contaminans TaxID=488447 RepID=UPI001CF23C06|nr:hypothetical protein [Burkholderia contaminans]MCA7889048.1 hypothetical protein [Burkholderia contaminans]
MTRKHPKFQMKLMTVLATAVFLVACGKKNPDPDTSANVIPKFNTNPNVVLAAAASEAAAAASAAAAISNVALPQADASMPLDHYLKVDDAGQQLALFYAVSGEPVDYEKAAEAISLDYRNTTDVFKRKALLGQIKPKIDAQVAAFKNNRYVMLSWGTGQLGHYDMAGQFFPVNGLPMRNGDHFWFNGGMDHPLMITNGEKFEKFPVADQTKAQQIEADISHYTNPMLGANFYLFAQGVDLQTNSVKLQLVQLGLNDSKGNLIGTIR